METKNILFLLRQPPYATSHALEALEAVLVAGVFDQRVSVLFKGDGVWQLVDGQDGAGLERRTVANVARALPQYDVTDLYACAASLEQRGLAAGDLVLDVQVLDLSAQQALIARHDAVVND
jgi:tRNA 2-thiouridine synthesizing protein C